MTPTIYQTIGSFSQGEGPPPSAYRTVKELRFFVDGELVKEILIDPKTVENLYAPGFYWPAFGGFSQNSYLQFEFGQPTWYSDTYGPLSTSTYGITRTKIRTYDAVAPLRGTLDDIAIWRACALTPDQVADRASASPLLLPTYDNGVTRFFDFEDSFTTTNSAQSPPVLTFADQSGNPITNGSLGAWDGLFGSQGASGKASIYDAPIKVLSNTWRSLGGYFEHVDGLRADSTGAVDLNAFMTDNNGAAIDMETGLTTGTDQEYRWRGVGIKTPPTWHWYGDIDNLDPLCFVRDDLPEDTPADGFSLEWTMQTTQSEFDMDYIYLDEKSSAPWAEFKEFQDPASDRFFICHPISDEWFDGDDLGLYFLPDGSVRWGELGTPTYDYDTEIWAGPVNDGEPHHFVITQRNFLLPQSYDIPTP
jgi:hypothetical protein